MLPGFLSLEREEAIKDIARIEQALDNEIKHLDALVQDWAAWDDTYDFVAYPADDYIDANLPVETFEDLGLDLFYIIDIQGRVMWSRFRNLETNEEIRLDDFPEERFPGNHPLVFHDSENMRPDELSVSGIFMTQMGPLLISARPILKSSNEGPVRGSLIMGYFVDRNVAESISGQTRIELTITPYSKDLPDLDSKKLSDLVEGKKKYLLDDGPKAAKLGITTLFQDIDGKPALVLKAELPRKIMEKGYQTYLYAAGFFLVTMVTALSVMLFLIQQGVLKPISKLTSHIRTAKRDHYDYRKFSIDRRDEIGILSREFGNMLTQLRNRSRKLEELNSALIVDIDKRKKAEDALRESEERFKALLENLPVGVFVHDLDEKILLVNDVACDNTGYSRDELLSKSLVDINPDNIAGKEDARLWKNIKNGKSVVIESVNLRKDGTRYPVEVHLTRIVLEGKSIILALVFDITERKHAEAVLKESEEKLARSKKMESLGLLAGGVAHDLNNVLSGIVSYPELILMDLPEGSKLINPLKTMQTSGKRAVAIVQDLLTVARGVAVEKQPLNLNRIVNRYLDSAEHGKLLQYHEGIVVKTDLDSQLLNIKGSMIHIGKSLMNLVSNAAEAMETGGEIIIKTENRYLDKPLGGYEEVTEGEYAVLTVRDTGPGISPGDMERIFEPFYTKKVMGRSGTGLGLAIVWNVLQEHMGYIDVVSEGSGTAFELYFPITREEIKVENTSLSIKDYSGNGQKILVVDDVESQREIFCTMLNVLGYQPATVSGGEEAVEYLKENKVDLVILDMIMDPGISGRETYERILKFHPGQKAIIVSGFAETDDVRAAQRLGAGRYIKKPVQLENIGLAIKAELSK